MRDHKFCFTFDGHGNGGDWCRYGDADCPWQPPMPVHECDDWHDGECSFCARFLLA
jgi:hypothetical protein